MVIDAESDDMDFAVSVTAGKLHAGEALHFGEIFSGEEELLNTLNGIVVGDGASGESGIICEYRQSVRWFGAVGRGAVQMKVYAVAAHSIPFR